MIGQAYQENADAGDGEVPVPTSYPSEDYDARSFFEVLFGSGRRTNRHLTFSPDLSQKHRFACSSDVEAADEGIAAASLDGT
jgi:hypothetical protein